jgi:hypothetical protein
MAKAKYCCFFCPENDYSEKELTDPCPRCGREYGIVLSRPPEAVGRFKIVRPLARGFYGATYIAKAGSFERHYVIKVSPASFYGFFHKAPFEEEVALHARLAGNAFHVVNVSDAFEENVAFGTKEDAVLCNVTVLDYVDGPTLGEFVRSASAISAKTVCQIAIDLLRLREEFANNKLYHNDLHAENLILERLPAQMRRPDAVDESVRLMAIDLGSAADGSKSDSRRKGDLEFVADHVKLLVGRLVANPTAVDDRDFRIALALQGLIVGIQAEAQNIRIPNASDLIEQIREVFYRASYAWRPWQVPFALKSLADHYNAQTLDSWNVPRLLVDPDGRWLAEVTQPGPQIITGMRGCGKTMLLRALDLHARAARREGESAESALARIRQDHFVGLFASAQRLLDLREQPLHKMEHRQTRLFAAYALQAVRVLLHIRDLDKAAVVPDAHRRLAETVVDYFRGAESLRQASSLDDLENRLLKVVVLTLQGNQDFTVNQAPPEVFSHLAEGLLACSPVFQGASVLYLLDDVSTRYLELEKIASLLSGLLFQSPVCAFKFTSEWQTIELGLRSPGRIHPIRENRDLRVFDLGADVHKEISSPGAAGKEFVAQILVQRAKLLASAGAQRDPRVILGDVPLEQVATEIAGANEGSAQKKRVYRGLSCLTNVCVGDIGDVIKLYEDILRHAGDPPAYPISSEAQSACFQETCAKRLYDLNRRANYFKNHALAFAQAAHDLLVRSFRERESSDGTSGRLRQYSSLYVRITTENEGEVTQQIDRLRELIDSGVFVFSGGAPRSKTKDANPIQQFILTFRKLYGLAAYVGLADRDRFELSGDDLSRWLANPGEAREILLRNQSEQAADLILGAQQEDERRAAEGLEKVSTGDMAAAPVEQAQVSAPRQSELFAIQKPEFRPNREEELRALGAKITIRQIHEDELKSIGVSRVVTGLGFEERTLASNEYLAAHLAPVSVHAVRYSIEGHAKPISNLWRHRAEEFHETAYWNDSVPNTPAGGLLMVDVSGLAKPTIFLTVREELIRSGRVAVCHAAAKQYYPLEEDLTELFSREEEQDPLRLLESLDKVLRGETGPYSTVRLLNDESDPSRSRALVAFASSKHQRLFSLLDAREYDRIDILAPSGKSLRARVAMHAAEFVCQNYSNASVAPSDTTELEPLVRYLDRRYLEIYGLIGANVELGLTGSKIQAVAAAVVSGIRKFSQAWYLSPKEFDVARFSKGVGAIRTFLIEAPHLLGVPKT